MIMKLKGLIFFKSKGYIVLAHLSVSKNWSRAEFFPKPTLSLRSLAVHIEPVMQLGPNVLA